LSSTTRSAAAAAADPDAAHMQQVYGVLETLQQALARDDASPADRAEALQAAYASDRQQLLHRRAEAEAELASLQGDVTMLRNDVQLLQADEEAARETVADFRGLMQSERKFLTDLRAECDAKAQLYARGKEARLHQLHIVEHALELVHGALPALRDFLAASDVSAHDGMRFRVEAAGEGAGETPAET
ncbi:MAG: hypothetical protein ACK4L4_20140, partial [Gemmobacter sp.]